MKLVDGEGRKNKSGTFILTANFKKAFSVCLEAKKYMVKYCWSERVEGLIYLQGIEGGRAFSFVIHEATGRLAAAIARDGLAVTVFGACTDKDNWQICSYSRCPQGRNPGPERSIQ